MSKANPGGQIAPDDVIGRDELIEQIWDRLEQQCVLINAERRIGKTSVLKKMLEEPRDGWMPVFQDLERIHSAEDFAVEVHRIVQTYLDALKKGVNLVQRLLETSSTETIDFKGRSWQHLLEDAIRDLVREKSDTKLVWFWDEVPYMVENIRKSQGEAKAAQVLDTLRSLRQQYPEIRMVFTGSIGLHHVLASIKSGHVATEPVNDMYALEVLPLSGEHAALLAERLVLGEELECHNLEEACAAIADESDCFPFYIHHIVCALKIQSKAASAESVKELVQDQLVAAGDPWELAHYRTRIPDYYKLEGDSEIVTIVLDYLADGTERNVGDLLNDIASQTKVDCSRERLLPLLRLMERDHYLRRSRENVYGFRFPLVRRWWKLDRGL